MELHQLRYFVAVAELKNFTQAAARCFVSQPSLSQQIQKLEQELEQQLFDRLGRKVALTAAGEALFERARTILLEVEDAARAVKEEQEGSGHLRLGVLPSIGPYLLPELLRRIRVELPGAKIEVDEDFRGPLIEALVAGRLDLIIGSLPPSRPDIEVETLFQEPLLVALASDDPLAKKRVLEPTDLAGRKLVLLGETSSLGTQARRFFGDNQIPVEIACRCAQVTMMKELVAAGLGIGIVPRMAMKPLQSGMVYRSMADVPSRRDIVLIRRRRRFQSRTAEKFVEVLREFCKMQRESDGEGDSK